MKLQKDHLYTFLIWGIVLLSTGLYLSLIFNENIWTDEAFTLQLIKGNTGAIISGTARDVHPPLYYLYAKSFKVFGDSLIVQKLAAIIPMSATLVLGATVIRRHFGNITALFFLLFISCIPCSMEFAVQVRMYSLALFCVTTCGLFAYLAYSESNPRNFIIFALSGAGAAYLHYFAFVSVIAITGILLLTILLWRRENFFKWFLSAMGMIILYLPWMPSFIRQVRSVTADYWIPEITGETVWNYFVWLFDLKIVQGTVFVFIILLIGLSHYNTIQLARTIKGENLFALICMLIPVITAVAGLLLSRIFRPVYREQYVFPALGLLALFVGITLQNAKKSILVILSAFFILVGAGQYREVFRQEYTETNTPQTLALLRENMREDDYIAYNYDIFRFIYECYWLPEQLVFIGDFDFSAEFDTVWFLNSEWTELTVSESVLAEHNLSMERVEGEFGIEDNLFSIYKITKGS